MIHAHKNHTSHPCAVIPQAISIVLCAVMVLSWPGVLCAEPVTHTFRESEALLANPGQGWMSQQTRPSQDATARFPYALVYRRINWVDVEPEPGQYRWDVIDRVIDAWKGQHAAVAIRIMTCNAHSQGYYSSPKWLFDAGCRGFEYVEGGDDPTKGGKRITRIEPDYADPIYLERHGAFLAAMGARYDGHPNVAFLDIGSYGVWGEWHTQHPAPVEVRRAIVDLYVQAFHDTPLVFMTDDAQVLPYALSKGIGLRRDGVGSPWHEQNWIGTGKYTGMTAMAESWKKAPVIFEWYGNYDYFQQRQWSLESAVAFMLKHHVTAINDNIGRFPDQAKPLLDQLTRLAGARLVLRKITHAPTVTPGQSITLSMTWANVGVGKIYQDTVLRLLLLDQNEQTLSSVIAVSDPRTWLPGEFEMSEPMPVPARLAAGEYTLALELADQEGHRPNFRLAIECPEKDGRYTVSRIKIP
ncbi:MAG: DUF4832 domain-containing protein [Phycisphaerae bacterium]|nr:DUF4832 domain-containing protein [Phycisphaerae bacterium]